MRQWQSPGLGGVHPVSPRKLFPPRGCESPCECPAPRGGWTACSWCSVAVSSLPALGCGYNQQHRCLQKSTVNPRSCQSGSHSRSWSIWWLLDMCEFGVMENSIHISETNGDVPGHWSTIFLTLMSLPETFSLSRSWVQG